MIQCKDVPVSCQLSSQLIMGAFDGKEDGGVRTGRMKKKKEHDYMSACT